MEAIPPLTLAGSCDVYPIDFCLRLGACSKLFVALFSLPVNITDYFSRVFVCIDENTLQQDDDCSAAESVLSVRGSSCSSLRYDYTLAYTFCIRLIYFSKLKTKGNSINQVKLFVDITALTSQLKAFLY